MNPISERIMGIIKSDKTLSQKKMSIATGFSTGTINSWLKRGSAIPADAIMPICDYLSLSPEYVLTGEEKEIDGLQPEEKHILQAYNRLSDSGRAKLNAYAAGLLDAEEVRRNA